MNVFYIREVLFSVLFLSCFSALVIIVVDRCGQ